MGGGGGGEGKTGRDTETERQRKSQTTKDRETNRKKHDLRRDRNGARGQVINNQIAAITVIYMLISSAKGGYRLPFLAPCQLTDRNRPSLITIYWSPEKIT